ncbi:hypothetical protein H6S82_02160 [Planktothrix sp. FACHB-1355]|uniref:SPOR domain-containing protein n=1 Tax=Aerosakkonema funiforme FACHB-1375 TaxID=2949571 RepID=A0A926ZKK7_9CYAN|nr:MULTISPECIES: hypothetical protein [Oscillatoriales]MBD2185889.1 hypothetical protein [Aerosakkonema funiforme FACHB-1375]MBD3557668.1 hypothetical protein [Planktothrix sp. FACHB-1355]
MSKIAIERCCAVLSFAIAVALLPAFAVRPQALAQVTATPPSENSPAYNPQPLGTGYAVLVDYFNQPEIAAQVQEALKKEVGLVSYGQRPYLLVLHTTDQKNATSIFEDLSDRGFWVMLVDSDKVTLLRARVEATKIR